MLPWPGEIRLARDEDGPAIGKLFAEAQYPDQGVDWETGVGGWWIVGELDRRIRGAVQMAASQPYGYIGEVLLHPEERGRHASGKGVLAAHPGSLGVALYLLAMSLLKRAGCQWVMGFVDAPSHRQLLERYGGVVLGEGFTLMGRRLA